MIFGTSDWDSFTRAQFEVDTKTDTELGTLRGFIGFRGNADNGSSASSSVFVDQAFIELGGLKVGKFYNWWDDDLSGETDLLSSTPCSTPFVTPTTPVHSQLVSRLTSLKVGPSVNDLARQR